MKNIMRRILSFLSTLGKGIADAWSRIVNGYDSHDISDFQSSMFIRLSKVLVIMSERIDDAPRGYAEDKRGWLRKRDLDSWVIEPVTAKRNRVFANNGVIPRNGEVNQDAAMWTEDIMYAAMVLKRRAHGAAEWAGDNRMFGKTIADRRASELEREFKRTWKWVGDNLPDL
jgi:hypothetical protein